MRRFTIILDRPRELVYSFGAWDILSGKFGPEQGGTAETFDILKVGVTARDLPFLIYAGLATDDPDLTVERIKELLHGKIASGEYTILGLMNLIGEALFAHIGLSKAAAGAEKKTKSPSPLVPGGRKTGK
jgi:hypothetical protein